MTAPTDPPAMMKQDRDASCASHTSRRGTSRWRVALLVLAVRFADAAR